MDVMSEREHIHWKVMLNLLPLFVFLPLLFVIQCTVINTCITGFESTCQVEGV